MDDELVQRWRSGDERAEVTVRQHIRSIVGRVLSHRALLLALGPEHSVDLIDKAGRMQLWDKITDAVMAHQAGGAGRLQAAALMRSLQMAVERVQETRPKSGDVHLPPQILVSLAVTSEGLGQAMLEASQRHLENCPICRQDLKLVEELRRSVQMGDGKGATHRRRLESPLLMKEQIKGDASQDSVRMIPFRSLPEPPKRRWLSVWPLIGATAIVAWSLLWQVGSPDPDSLEGVATLADLKPPPIGRLSDLPSEAQLALSELSQGQCVSAAGRLRELRERYPTEGRLYLLEGASFVCAADGRRALVSFDE